MRKLGLVSNEKTSHEVVNRDLLLHLLGSGSSSSTSAPQAERLSIFFVHAAKNLTSRAMIQEYRVRVLELAREALDRLYIGGYFIIGLQDTRLLEAPKQVLYPVGMVVCEDLEKLAPSGLILKEIVGVVPSTYSKHRDHTKESVTEYVGDMAEQEVSHLPIVHTFYLVYTKRKTSGK